MQTNLLLRPAAAFMERLRLGTKFTLIGIVAGIVVAWLFFNTTAGAARAIVALVGLALMGYLTLGAYVAMRGALRKVVEGGRKIAAGDFTARIDIGSDDE